MGLSHEFQKQNLRLILFNVLIRHSIAFILFIAAYLKLPPKIVK